MTTSAALRGGQPDVNDLGVGTSPVLLGLPFGFLGDRDRHDGGDPATARCHVGDPAADGRVVEYVGEVRPQLLHAHLFSHDRYGTSGRTRVHSCT